MKKIVALLLLTGTACAPAMIQGGDSFSFNGKSYQTRSVDGDFLSVYAGNVISGEHEEVKIEGNWYKCDPTCIATVKRVLAAKSAKKAAAGQAAKAAAANTSQVKQKEIDGGSGGY